jgi:hypothetical protein
MWFLACQKLFIPSIYGSYFISKLNNEYILSKKLDSSIFVSSSTKSCDNDQ